MAKTSQAIFPQTPSVGVLGVVLSTAMTSTKAFDGTEAAGTSMALIGTAGATDGARIDQLVINYSGTAGAAPSGTSNATVLRLWINNGSVNTTAANNVFAANVSIPAMLYSNTTAMSAIIVPINISIPPGYRLYAGLSTAMGGTACALAVFPNFGDY